MTPGSDGTNTEDRTQPYAVARHQTTSSEVGLARSPLTPRAGLARDSDERRDGQSRRAPLVRAASIPRLVPPEPTSRRPRPAHAATGETPTPFRSSWFRRNHLPSVVSAPGDCSSRGGRSPDRLVPPEPNRVHRGSALDRSNRRRHPIANQRNLAAASRGRRPASGRRRPRPSRTSAGPPQAHTRAPATATCPPPPTSRAQLTTGRRRLSRTALVPPEPMPGRRDDPQPARAGTATHGAHVRRPPTPGDRPSRHQPCSP